MWDWLNQTLNNAPKTTPGELLVRLFISGLLGFGVARVYRWTRRTGTWPPTFPSTLVLLSILIAMVTQVIGDNVARAFSLVGALSIVRFRTVVQDTQDTAFVIFAVVVGMAVVVVVEPRVVVVLVQSDSRSTEACSVSVY